MVEENVKKKNKMMDKIAQNSIEKRILVMGGGILCVCILAVIFISILMGNKIKTNLTNIYNQEMIMKEVQTIVQDQVMTNKGEMVEDVVKTLVANTDLDGVKYNEEDGTYWFTEEQLNQLVDSVVNEVYSKYSDVLDEENFRIMVTNIINGSSKFISIEDFKTQINEFVSKDEELDKMIQELNKNLDISIEDLNVLISSMWDDHNKDVDSIKKTIEDLSSTHKDDFDEVMKVIKEFQKTSGDSFKDVNDLIEQLTNDTNTSITNIISDMEELKDYVDTQDNALKAASDANDTIHDQNINKNSENIGSLNNLDTSSKDSLVSAINEVFQLVSNGKALLASTITDLGVSTPSDATFYLMSENIKALCQIWFQRGIDSVENPPGEIEYTYHHHHTGSGTNSLDVIYSTSNPGGCYVSAGHTHNKTGTCSSHSVETGRTKCGHYRCTSRSGGYSYFECTGCGNKVSHYDGGASEDWGYGDHWIYSYSTVWDCGSPTNTWIVGCGYLEGQIVEAHIVYPPGYSNTSYSLRANTLQSDPVEYRYVDNFDENESNIEDDPNNEIIDDENEENDPNIDDNQNESENESSNDDQNENSSSENGSNENNNQNESSQNENNENQETNNSDDQNNSDNENNSDQNNSENVENSDNPEESVNNNISQNNE